jgi:hypothetical protein
MVWLVVLLLMLILHGESLYFPRIILILISQNFLARTLIYFVSKLELSS